MVANKLVFLQIKCYFSNETSGPLQQPSLQMSSPTAPLHSYNYQRKVITSDAVSEK